MDPYTRESKFWYALAYGKPQELPEPVSATEHYMRLFALKQLGGQKAENALEIKAAAKEFLPCHLEAEFDFRTLDWNRIDSMDKTFDQMDAAEMTWNQIDAYSPE